MFPCGSLTSHWKHEVQNTQSARLIRIGASALILDCNWNSGSVNDSMNSGFFLFLQLVKCDFIYCNRYITVLHVEDIQ